MNKDDNNTFNEKFIVDYMLGRLCRWLRILGYDSAYYRPEAKDKDGNIVFRSLKEHRILVTRNLDLKNSAALKTVIVEDDDFRKQLKELIDKTGLNIDRSKMFSRCPECNSKLFKVAKKNVRKRVPSYVYETHDRFSKCRDCENIYWEGTHKNLIEDILKDIA